MRAFKKKPIFICMAILIFGLLVFLLLFPSYHAAKFQQRQIDPVLKKIGLYSPAASNLLLGTAMQESCLGRITEGQNIFQIDDGTAVDVQKNFLSYRPNLRDKVQALYNKAHTLDWNVNHNTKWQVAIARIVYLRSGKPLPNANDKKALAKFWKKHYNTYLGAGNYHEFYSIYNHYIWVGFWRCNIKYHYFKYSAALKDYFSK